MRLNLDSLGIIEKALVWVVFWSRRMQLPLICIIVVHLNVENRDAVSQTLSWKSQLSLSFFTAACFAAIDIVKMSQA